MVVAEGIAVVTVVIASTDADVVDNVGSEMVGL